MPSTSPTVGSPHRVSRLLGFALLFFSIAGLFLFLVLLVLPLVVSSEPGQAFIRHKTAAFLGRAVDFDTFRWSWSHGITLRQLSISDDPAFSNRPLLFIEQLRIKPDLKKLLSGEAHIQVDLTTLNVNAITNKDGTRNLDTLIASQQRPGSVEANDRPEKETVGRPSIELPTFPHTISFLFAVEKARLSHEDRTNGTLYGLANLSLLVQSTSLRKEGLSLNLGADLHAGEAFLPRSTLTVSVKNLFDDRGAVQIGKASAVARAVLPGGTARLDADLATSTVEAECRLNVGAVLDAMAPLLPNLPSGLQLDGTVTSSITTDSQPDGDVRFDMAVQGDALSMSGTSGQQAEVGPGTLAVNATGVVNPSARTLVLDRTDVRLLDNSRATLALSLSQSGKSNAVVELTLSDLLLDLHELVSFVSPLAPLPIRFGGGTGPRAVLAVDSAVVKGQAPTGTCDVQLSDITLHLPETRVADKTDFNHRLHLSGGRLQVTDLRIRLVDLFPEFAELFLTMSADRLSGNLGQKPLHLSGLRVHRFHGKARQMAPAKGTAFGFTGRLAVDHRMQIESLRYADLFQADDVATSLQGKAAVSESDALHAHLGMADASAGRVRVATERWGPVDTGLTFRADSCEVALRRLKPLEMDLTDVEAKVDLEKVLALSLRTDLWRLPDPQVKLNFTLGVDLEALRRKMPAGLLPGISGKGKLDFLFTAVGRRPNQSEIQGLQKIDLEGHLAFVERMLLDVRITDGGLTYSLPGKEPFAVRSLQAAPLIRYELNGRSGKGQWTSVVSATETTGIGGLNRKTPVSGRLTATGGHTYLKSLDLRPHLLLSPAGANAAAEVSIEGLDRVIGQHTGATLNSLLTKVGGTVSLTADIPEWERISELGLPALSGIDLRGPTTASAHLRLRAGQSIDGGLALNADNLSLHLPQRIAISGFDANVDLTKSYQVRGADSVQPGEAIPPLSQRVVDLQRAVEPRPFEDRRIQNHLRRLHERLSPSPSFSIEQVVLAFPPIPITIDNARVMLNLDDGLPQLDFFECNLLGGTLNGSLSILGDRGAKSPVTGVNAAVRFSGIETANLFPETTSVADGGETNISGTVVADFPFSKRMRTLLAEARLNVAFTEIGASALERLLYALDPYENNEAIVSQRQLLQSGTPDRVSIEINDGFLTLRGRVLAKGLPITLPPIRRLNIAQIPGVERFEAHLAALFPAVALLEKLAAQTLVVDDATKPIAFE